MRARFSAWVVSVGCVAEIGLWLMKARFIFEVVAVDKLACLPSILWSMFQL